MAGNSPGDTKSHPTDISTADEKVGDVSPSSAESTPLEIVDPIKFFGPEGSDSSAQGRAESGVPDRYVLQTSEEEGTVLTCRETPNLTVRVEKGLTISATSAHKVDPGSIFLDGAAQGAPFLDTERHIYNLDHHEDCVRAFTLSTCEQAYILIRKGLKLRERDWTIYANEPDLDTVLAIWVLLNHPRLTDEEGEIRSKILPLIRLEGVIDVHGLELQELACLSPETFEETNGLIADLIEEELEIKREGRWSEIDPAEYTVERLRQIDRMVYSSTHFGEFEIIDELARVEITDSHIAVICRSESGIYQVEQQLAAVHQERLGIIVLQKDETSYTIRQVNLFLPVNLQRVYGLLNLIDPAVKGVNRWGGSDDIGGSPRATGTRLSTRQIAESLLQAYNKPTFFQLLSSVAVGAIAAVIALLSSWAVTQFWDNPPTAFITTYGVTSAVLLFLFARQYPRAFGWRLPVGVDWLLLLPPALLGGLAGGAWIPSGLVEDGTQQVGVGELLLLTLGLSLAAEVLFRSIVHGVLAEEFPPQRSGGRWFLSGPAIVSSGLYAAVGLTGIIPRFEVLSAVVPAVWLPADAALIGIRFAAALIFGICCAMARERSESVLAPILFHWLCLLVVLGHLLL